MTWKFYTTSGQIKQGSSSLGTDIPIGTILPYGRTVAPAGWLICDGTAVSRTTYSNLFGEIGTGFGVGNGSTTFNLPDLRGRVPVGRNGGTFATLGATGGVETHPLTATESGVPVHSHANTMGPGGNTLSGNDNTEHTHAGGTAGASNDHAHLLLNSGGAPMGFLSVCSGPISGGSTGATGYYIGQGAQTYHSNTSGHTADHSHAFSTGGRSAFHQHTMTINNANNSAANAAQAHQNLQPYQVVTYIIKALNVVSVELDVNISNLLDVDTAGATDGDTLTYDATAGSWLPTPNPTPIGVILDFYGAALPDGFLWCDGAAIPGGFADAIAIIGANTPDLRGRVTAGLDNIGGVDSGRLSIANTMGTTTGAQTHALSTAELASHAHTQQGSFGSGTESAAHTHGLNAVIGAATGAEPNITDGGNATPNYYHQSGILVYDTGTQSANHTHTTTISGSTVAAGSGTAHNNMQPTMVVNKIIRVV